MTSAGASFQVARSGTTVFVRSSGLANMKNAPTLEAFLNTAIEQGATTACIDLNGCTGMDSTFMGLLVGTHKLLSEHAGRLVVVNPGPSNLRLLVMLGVTLVVPVIESEPAPEVEFVVLNSEPQMGTVQRMELVLRAHQNLVKLSETNIGKFSAFLAALDRDLAKLKANKGE
jgi:anti-sigma B factor antagonist